MRTPAGLALVTAVFVGLSTADGWLLHVHGVTAFTAAVSPALAAYALRRKPPPGDA